MTDDHLFTTELISKVISEIKCGRASDIDGLMAEHMIRWQSSPGITCYIVQNVSFNCANAIQARANSFWI